MRVRSAAVALALVAFFAPVVPPSHPVAAQIMGPCSVLDLDLYTGGKLDMEDNGSSVWLSGMLYTDKKPSGPVTAEVKHVFAFRPDEKVGGGTADWEAVDTINAPWDIGQKYRLSWSGSISKSHDSFKDDSHATVRIVFYWSSGGDKHEDQTCKADFEL